MTQPASLGCDGMGWSIGRSPTARGGGGRTHVDTRGPSHRVCHAACCLSGSGRRPDRPARTSSSASSRLKAQSVACARPGGRLSGKKSLPRVPRQPILDAAFPKRSVIKTINQDVVLFVPRARGAARQVKQALKPGVAQIVAIGSWKPPGSGWNSKLERLEANTLTKTLP